ncbi:hypothetical protein [Natrinema sp. 1APR25-10V2]|uniref:DUF7576 family protein n=1 Tax=Natrinema sp. 1APR25-10V2 TaxID=2951081 RepID=UPI002874A3F2|nr:hypothetical protein [Natrinema sp. 1APR25-10V2]MDS0475684.1 hypothetical protein [Natrinema sp. 1APR25-10V2]
MEYQYSEPASPSAHHRLQEATTCHACEATIGARDRQLTWRIRDGADVFEYHYCSDACLPATAPDQP